MHTPGPWNFACDSYGKVRHSRKDCVYTNVRNPGGDRLVTLAGRIEKRADARLMAAAPDLLAALEALAAWDEIPLDDGDNADWEALNAVVVQARAAIAKAKGAQP